MDHALCSTVRHSTIAICTWVCSALLLSGCSLFRADPDEVAAEKMQELLLQEAFGDAAFEIAGNEIFVTITGEAESGLFLRASERADEPIIIRYAYLDAAPLNLRIKRGESYEYFSAAAQTFILLGPGHASEALFYGTGPRDFRVEVKGISTCGKENYICMANGRVEQTFGGAGLKNRLLIDTYGNARLDGIGKRSAIALRNSPQGEYGLALRLAEDDQEQNYVLEFEVDRPEHVTLRVNRGGQLRYHSAKRRWARIDANTEILMFSSEISQFEVGDLRLSECDADEWRCRTAEDFAELLPGDPSDTGPERLITLTKWVSQNADYASSESVAGSLETTGLTASQMYYKYYEPSRAGGYCGATAVFLTRTLRSQGYEAFTIDFGLRDGRLTHVTTIVAIEDHFYLVDATFGAYFAAPGTNRMIDLFDVLDGAVFDFRTLDMSGREFIFSKKEKEKIDRLKERSIIGNCKTSKDHPVVVCNQPGFGLEAYLENFSVPLRQNNLESSPQALIELLRQGVFSIGTSEDIDAMRRFVHELDARSIPLAESPRRLIK